MVQRTQPDTLTVAGEAAHRVPPEAVELVVAVLATGGSASRALQQNAVHAQRIANRIMAFVDQKPITTVSLVVYPKVYATSTQLPPNTGSLDSSHSRNADTPSFQAEKLLRIELNDYGRLGELIDVLTAAGAIVVYFRAFAQDESARKRTVLQAACRDAQSRAESAASALGLKLGGPTIIVEDVCASFNGTPSHSPMSGAGVPDQTNPLPNGCSHPEHLTFRARVSITFRIR